MLTDELKELTEKAIEKGNKKRQQIIEENQEDAIRQCKEEESKAQGIIIQIPERAKAEATVGRHHAIVMEIGRDYKRPYEDHDYNKCDIEWLRGVAKRVFDYCLDARLQPTLEFWHDGMGMNSGFNIVIHW